MKPVLPAALAAVVAATLCGGAARSSAPGTADVVVAALAPGADLSWSAWSPDGSRVGYEACGTRRCSFYVVRADGGGRRRVAMMPRGSTYPSGGAWSPDGSRIAYTACVERRCDIYVVTTGTGVSRKLTNTSPTVGSSGNAWSPDGRTIAFYRYRPAPDRGFWTSELYLMDADGSHVRRLTHTVGEMGLELAQDGRSIVWSPDGSRIAYNLDPAYGQVYVVAADGRGQRRLSPDGNYTHPAWSPDGRTIAATLLASGGRGEIHVFRADGGGERRLTETGKFLAWFLQYSRDGRRMLCVTSRGRLVQRDLAVMRSDGTHRRLLTHTPDAWEDVAAWSPDDRLLAFIRWHTVTRDGVTTNLQDDSVHLATGDGRKERTIAEPYSSLAQWSPGGRSLLYVRSAGTPEHPAAEIHAVRLDRLLQLLRVAPP